MNGLDARGHFPIQLCQKGDAFPLPLALGRCGIHVPGARVKAGKQMQCAFASLFVLDRTGLPGCAAKVGALRVRGCKRVFSSTHSPISHPLKGRV